MTKRSKLKRFIVVSCTGTAFDLLDFSFSLFFLFPIFHFNY